METPGRKVLYEIRHHASLPYVPRYPPLPQVQDSSYLLSLTNCFVYSVYLYLTLRFDLLSKFRQMELIRKEGFGLLSPLEVSRRWLIL